MNKTNDMLRHGKRRPMGAGDVLTCVKVHKVVVSLAVIGGSDSDGTESVLSCNSFIAFLGGLYVRTKLDLTILVEVQTAASDDSFGADGAGQPIFSGDGVIPKDVNGDYTNVKCNGKLLEWGSREPSTTTVFSGAYKAFSFWYVISLSRVV